MPSDLGGSGGRLISYPDRKQYCALIDEAVQNGARQRLACELVGIASRTYQRWNQGEELSEDQRIHTADLIEDIAYREKIDKNQLVIHSDNGSPMKGTTLRAKMIDLEISPSYSRPRVSNDNPYSESLFKTVKYHYTYPEGPFTDLSEARHWIEKFVHWYNDEHQHSAIKFVTPNQRHSGLDRAILENRKKVIEAARKNHPERWNGRKTMDLTPVGDVYLNPDKDENNATENKLPLKSAA